ncbi:MAG: hypothetical protein ACTHL8_17295 [Burkholderiaceae bacterium]
MPAPTRRAPTGDDIHMHENPPMIRIRELDHLVLRVADLPAMLRF